MRSLRLNVLCFLILSNLTGFQSFAQKALPQIDKVVKLAEDQYKGYIEKYPDSTQHPRSTNEDGSILLTSSRNWTSGFFAGNLWYLYNFTKDNQWKEAAEKWTETLEEEKKVTITHDLGFILYNSFGNGYHATKDPKYKEVLLEGAYTLIKRFNPKIGAIRSWNHQPYTYPVIVDNLMNLEFLLWAFKETGDSTFYNVVKSHADTDMKYRFRKDNSTFHVLDFDPETGNLLAKKTHQGFSDSSCWARGQAWAIYGYAMLYRETKDKRYLNQSVKACDYFINQISKVKDHIPYWDFNDPKIPNAPRDASAAAVAASGMIELSKLTGKKKYLQEAETILNSLSSEEYLAKTGTNNFFLLKHSTGHKPKNSEVDVPLVYADYYLLEALFRYKDYHTL
jgi:unsaturated chondroitin disaccharide hydrolase